MKRILLLTLLVLAPVLFYEICIDMVSILAYQYMGVPAREAAVEKTAVGAVMAILILGRCYRGRPDSAGGVRDAVGPVFAGMGACVVGNLIISILNIFSPAYQQTRELLYAPGVAVQLLCLGVIIPAAEELVFRGFCFRHLRSRCSFLPAAVLSSLLFACFHGNMVQGIYSFGIGMLLAWGSEQYRALWPAMVIHMSANVVSVIVSGTAAGRWVMADGGRSWMFVVLSACLLIIGIRMMREKGKRL